MGIGNTTASAVSTTCPSPTHYPSWGSETDGGPDGKRQAAVLITPHGDRKPDPPAAGLIAGITALITPHGDRKPIAKHNPAAPAYQTHYPSWGSETLEEARAVGHTAHSLPLMGIGNLQTRQR